MDVRPFDYVAAQDSAHAVALLAKHGSSARILAGGTDLLVELKGMENGPAVVVDISRARDLKGVAVTDQGLRIGALTTHAEIMHSSIVQEMFPALVKAAHAIGAVQTRNLGTLGGNLMSAVPSMDSGPILIALDALVTVVGNGGARQFPLEQLFAGPKKTILMPGELLADVIIPTKNLGKPAAFEKFGLRKGQALALVNAGASLRLDGDNQRCAQVRIALGAVASTVIRARAAETYLEGRAMAPEAVAEAGRIAAGETKPISDFRASADYRRQLAAVLTGRALNEASRLAMLQHGRAMPA